ncbi:MAG: hypothetical protein IPG67_11205 [Acidobacteria bacterium]|nr:hypothetical protein [Acidobacteriota bacterium]
MTTVGNVLYTTEPDGNLYRTEITTGVKTAVGKGFQSEKFLFSNGTNLYSITAGGDLQKHFPSTIIASRNWINVRLLTTDSAFLYTIEKDGGLYRTDLISAVKTRIGTNPWPGAKLFCPSWNDCHNWLFTNLWSQSVNWRGGRRWSG